MIFSNKIHKLPSGKNISLFAKDSNKFDLFIFNNNTEKKDIIISSVLQCLSTGKQYNFNSVIKLNDNYLCVCYDDNMSVVLNDEG